jgi:hypothetical protein
MTLACQWIVIVVVISACPVSGVKASVSAMMWMVTELMIVIVVVVVIAIVVSIVAGGMAPAKYSIVLAISIADRQV